MSLVLITLLGSIVLACSYIRFVTSASILIFHRPIPDNSHVISLSAASLVISSSIPCSTSTLLLVTPFNNPNSVNVNHDDNNVNDSDDNDDNNNDDDDDDDDNYDNDDNDDDNNDNNDNDDNDDNDADNNNNNDDGGDNDDDEDRILPCTNTTIIPDADKNSPISVNLTLRRVCIYNTHMKYIPVHI